MRGACQMRSFSKSLRRAGSSAYSLAGMFGRLLDPAVLEALQTQTEQAEALLAQGTLSEKELWVPIPDLVESITAALEACSKAARSTLLRDQVLDGTFPDDDESVKGPYEESVKDFESKYVAKIYAISEEWFAEEILGAVMHVNGACMKALAKAAVASAPPDVYGDALPCAASQPRSGSAT